MDQTLPSHQGLASLLSHSATASSRDRFENKVARSIQVQSESDRLINLLDLVRRKSRDLLLYQDFRQSRDVIKIDHAASRHAVTSIQDNLNGNSSNGTRDRRDRNRSAYVIRRIAA